MTPKFSTPALGGLTALALLLAPAAQAQQPAPAASPASSAAAPTPTASAPTANPLAGGPLISGVCFLSQEGVIARSKIGQGATQRLRDLGQKVQADLTAEKGRLEARGKALEAKRATMTPLQFQAQAQSLNQRAQALQAQAGERSQQLEAAKSRAFNEVIGQAQPFIAQAYSTHGCGLLLAREAALAGNLANDLTPEVVAGLDAKGVPVSVELPSAK